MKITSFFTKLAAFGWGVMAILRGTIGDYEGLERALCLALLFALMARDEE